MSFWNHEQSTKSCCLLASNRNAVRAKFSVKNCCRLPRWQTVGIVTAGLTVPRFWWILWTFVGDIVIRLADQHVTRTRPDHRHVSAVTLATRGITGRRCRIARWCSTSMSSRRLFRHHPFQMLSRAGNWSAVNARWYLRPMTPRCSSRDAGLMTRPSLPISRMHDVVFISHDSWRRRPERFARFSRENDQ